MKRYNHGIHIAPDGENWKVFVCGFVHSTHATEAEADERATRLETLEEAHYTRYGRSVVA